MSMRAARGVDEQLVQFDSLGALVVAMAPGLDPPSRMKPSEAAKEYRKLSNVGSYSGPWQNETTPYMVEPMDCKADRSLKGIVFVGAAQSAKTDAMVVNEILHMIVCDPVDTILYQTTKDTARDFSHTRIDRMLRHSKEAGARLLPGGKDNNVHDKHFVSGTVLNISWPAISEMSGKPRALAILTDYDRMPQNIEGEGSPWALAMQRTKSFRSAGKTIAESTPGFEVKEGASWIPKTPHEAPPCEGILALYNTGDRRRWYWKCPSCREWFEPMFSLLKYDANRSPYEAGQGAYMACPHNGCVIPPSAKYELNKAGRWVRDGQRLTEDDQLVGEGVFSSIASFWIQGVAAAFASWSDLVEKYLNAEAAYNATGDQTALITTTNQDQGLPYRRKGQNTARVPEQLKNRADIWARGTVPDDVRLIVTTMDVQGRKWVVQVHGIRPGAPYDVVLIDRYDITKSNRLDDEGERMLVEPATYLEDWELLKPVIEREYPLADGSGRMMKTKHVFCDSGGRDGVTSMAYAFWAKLRSEPEGLHARFQLVKGDPTPGAPRAHITYPDAQRKDRKAGLRGDVPVLMLASNLLKDQLDAWLSRTIPGGGQILWPEWLPDAFFVELCTEVRELKGWVNPQRRRNEAWDLLYYLLGSAVWLGLEHIDWSRPPSWAAEWDANSMIRAKEQEVLFSRKNGGEYGMDDIAELLA